MALPHIRQARHARYRIATPSTPPIDQRAGSQLSVTDLLFSVVHMVRPPNLLTNWTPRLFQNDCAVPRKWFRRPVLPGSLGPHADRTAGHLGRRLTVIGT